MSSRYKISYLKISIWNKLRELQRITEETNDDVRFYVENIYQSFNTLTGKDPEIKYRSGDIVRLFELSINLLSLITDNYSKDKKFRCLRVLSDLLCVDLWQRAYIGLGKVDISVLNSVSTFVQEEKKTIIAYCGQIATQDNLYENIKILEKNGSSASLDSLNYRYLNGGKLITNYETELNAKLEEMVAKQQKGAIHSDEIISSFKYSDEVMKENNAEFEKVKKASSSHYAFVRAEREAFLVEQQNDNNENDPALITVEKEINNSKSLFKHIQGLIDSESPDIVGAYANLRFSIDSYAKYVCGIDFNLGFNGRKEYKSSDMFNVMFGYQNGKRINEIWDKSSEIMHAGDEQLTLELDPRYIASLKGEVLGYAKTLDELIGGKLDNIDFIEGVKRLYIARYEATQNFLAVCEEKNIKPGSALNHSKKQLNSYKGFLLQKGVGEDFFADYPEFVKQI